MKIINMMNKTKETYTSIEHKNYQNKLSFPKDVEAHFLNNYYHTSKHMTRIALIILFMFYALYGLFDFMINPITVKWSWIIRYAIICPIILSGLLLSYANIFKKIMQPLLSVISFISGIGIIAMICLSPGPDNGIIYFAGLILITILTYTIAKMWLIYATITSLLITISYIIAMIFFTNTLSLTQNVNLFINNTIFLILTNILGIIACFIMERYARQNFLQGIDIQEKQEKIDNEHKELLIRDEMNKIELEMAKEIQQQLIPSNSKEYIYSLYKPMELVGGDFYDFIEFRENYETGIFIGDVSGHGVSSALITSMIKTIIHESSYLKWNPADLLIHLNDSLLNKTGGKFITAFYCIYNHQTKHIKYTNAGHYPPFIITRNKVSKLPVISSLPLAVYSSEEVLYKNMDMKLPDNSKLLIYTDGIIDVKSPENSTKFFKDEIDTILINNYELNSRDFTKNILEEIIVFAGTEKLEDDICMVCIDV